jgi:hypothetical protein
MTQTAPSAFHPLINEIMKNRTDSPEVLRPSSALDTGIDLHRTFLFRLCYALRFSQPLSALFPPYPFQPCFMLVALLGFFPPELSPHLKLLRLPTLRSPPDVTSWLPPDGMQQAAFCLALSARPPPGFYSSSKSVHTMPSVTSNTAAVALLGFSPSKGLPQYAMSTPSRAFLSRALTPVCLAKGSKHLARRSGPFRP